MHACRIDRDGEPTRIGRDPARGCLHDELGPGDLAVKKLRRPKLLDEVDVEAKRRLALQGSNRMSSGWMPMSTGVPEASLSRMSETRMPQLSAETRPSPSTRPRKMFIGGEPMNVATKRVAGRR